MNKLKIGHLAFLSFCALAGVAHAESLVKEEPGLESASSHGASSFGVLASGQSSQASLGGAAQESGRIYAANAANDANDDNDGADTGEDAAQLREIEVFGAFVPKDTGVSTITKDELRSNIVKDLRDTTRMVPGVSVGNDARSGNSGYNIRGTDGNRVKMTLDGANMPYGITGWGHEGISFGRNIVEVDSVRSIGISKGPDATFSDGSNIGGKVAMRTIRPSDYVNPNKKNHFGVYPTYASANNLFKTSVLGARNWGGVSGLLMLTASHENETSTMGKVGGEGPKRTKANPREATGFNGLAKLEWQRENDSFEFVAEGYGKESKMDRLDARGPGYRGVITDSDLEDSVNRWRLGLDYKRYEMKGIFSKLDFNAWVNRTAYEKTDINDFSKSIVKDAIWLAPLTNAWRDDLKKREGQTSAIVDIDVDKEIFSRKSLEKFTQAMAGMSLRLDGKKNWGSARHDYALLLDYRYEDIFRPERSFEKRDGVWKEEDRSPVKWTPDTTSHTLGATLQDRVSFGKGWSVVPRVRFEYNDIRGRSDAAFKRSEVDWVPEYSNFTINPGLRIEKSFANRTTVYGSWSMGERNPPFMATTSFLHPPVLPGVDRMQFYPNKNIKSEKSNTFELGLRKTSDKFSFDAQVYYNGFRDFIELFGGKIETNNPKLYLLETVNRDKARTYGAEVAWSWKFHPSFTFSQAFTWMRGEAEDKGITMPLDTIQPMRLESALAWTGEKWRATLYWTLVARQDRWANPLAVQSPGYGVWDFVVEGRPWKHVAVQAGVYNIFSKRYFQPQNIQILNATNVIVTDIHSMPGINAALRLKMDW